MNQRVCIGPRCPGTISPLPLTTLLTRPRPPHRETPPTSKRRSPPLTRSTPPSLSPTRARRTKTRTRWITAAAAAIQVRWSCRQHGSRTATSRPPAHLTTSSLSRRPLRASPALFLTASPCLARSTTPTVQAPPLLPNPASSPQEATKVEPERREESGSNSALYCSDTSLSLTHHCLDFTSLVWFWLV